jgi:DNA polymerase III alpha subunit
MLKTDLVDRILLPSGVSVVEPDSPLLRTALRTGGPENIRVTEITPEIRQYNRYSDTPLALPSKSDLVIPPRNSTLPKEYKTLDVGKVVLEKLKGRFGTPSKEQLNRVKEELEWFILNDKEDVLRTMIMIVDRLIEHNIPWGVGRGSSVNSFVLFLIGVHDVDPIKYSLDWREFMRENQD